MPFPYTLSVLAGLLVLRNVQTPALVEKVCGALANWAKTAQSSRTRRPRVSRQPMASARLAVAKLVVFRTWMRPSKLLVGAALVGDVVVSRVRMAVAMLAGRRLLHVMIGWWCCL